MKFAFLAVCHCVTGRVRTNNEDNFYFDKTILPEDNDGLPAPVQTVFKNTDGPVFFGVFDGMGGEADGQVASHLAAQTFQKLCAKWRSGYRAVPFLNQIAQRMNRAVRERAVKGQCHMGTTAILGCFIGRSVFVFNIGDSRAFRFRRGRLRQISTDHTDAAFLHKQKIKNRKPRLTQFIGMYEEDGTPEGAMYRGLVFPGDRFLFCTDGITDMVPPDEIEEILNTYTDGYDAAKELVDAAMENGGRDNATAILICAE